MLCRPRDDAEDAVHRSAGVRHAPRVDASRVAAVDKRPFIPQPSHKHCECDKRHAMTH